MPESASNNDQLQSAQEMIDAAVAMPGVGDLMELYKQQAQIVRLANSYTVRMRPPVIVSAGTHTVGTGS